MLRPRTSLLLILTLTLLTIVAGAGAAHRAPASPTWTWIWAADGAHPPETVWFRHHFKLAQAPLSARLMIVGDDNYIAYLNGRPQPIARGNDWTIVQSFDVTRFFRAGENLLAVESQNNSGPGGLLYKILLRFPGGKSQTIVSNAEVRVNRRVPPQWNSLDLEDNAWSSAHEIAPAGQGPWGVLHGPPQPDPARIVRLWDIGSGGAPGENPYTRTRNVGDRMLMSASASSPSEMQILAGAGFTLFQTDSDHLSTEEVRPGRWDWRRPLAARTAVRSLGLNWCYFPHEAFPPAWYQKTVPFTPIMCLEHNQPVQAFSLWDPTWPAFIENGYKAMATALGGAKVDKREAGPRANNGTDKPKVSAERPAFDVRGTPLSALYVGIYGDYGEAGLLNGGRVSLPGQREDWERRFGNTHDHLGWWCADPLARADFRAKMLAKYGTLDKLNTVWKRSFLSSEAITYPTPLRPRPEARQEWLDFVEWYQGSVGQAVETNLAIARKYFPETLLLLPCGFAGEDPRGGNDNSLLPKIAAKYGAAVRSTHGAIKPLADNASTMLGRLGSACRFYNTPFWIEPGAAAQGHEAERIFEAVSQGAVGYFDWAGEAGEARDAYYRYNRFLRVEKPVVDVAMFYPAQAQKLRPEQSYAGLFAKAGAYLRDVCNYDIVDDRMVGDGCLARYRVLVLWEGMQADQATLDKIKAWVEDGGVLLAYDFGPITNFESDTSWYKDVFGYIQELQPAKLQERYFGVVPPQYRLLVGNPQTLGYLDDGWYEGETTAGVRRRWTKATANVRLPVSPDKSYTLVIRASVPSEVASLRRRVLFNGHEVGTLGAPGDVTYRFPITDTLLEDSPSPGLATLTFQSETFQPNKVIPGAVETRSSGVLVQSVQMVAQGETELADALPPPGKIQYQLDQRRLATSWTRKLGHGLTIYYPANRQLLFGYLEVVRRAVYHLSEIEKGRRDALPVDTEADGIYSTLFTNKVLFYNAKETRVTKTINIPAEAFAAWRGEVTIPMRTSWEITLDPHSLGAIYFGPEPQELLFECEKFTNLGVHQPLADDDCSPGKGATCVRLRDGASIGTRFVAEVGGNYTIYTRCLQNGRPAPVDVLVDGKPITLLDARAGQTLLSGTVGLTIGTHTLTLHARPNHDVRADFVLLTNDPTIGGYDFALRSLPIE